MLCRRYNDAFCAVEILLTKLCQKLALKNNDGASTGQKIGLLKLLKPSSQLSKKDAAHIKQFCADFSLQITIRNALAHSSMTLGTKDGEDVAFFQKAIDCAAANPIYMVMKGNDFSTAIASLNDMAQQLDKMLTLPALPSQTKQAATTNP